MASTDYHGLGRNVVRRQSIPQRMFIDVGLHSIEILKQDAEGSPARTFLPRGYPPACQTAGGANY